MRVSVMGGYAELRGALLFADPLSAGVAPGESVEVATALGLHARCGIRGASLWNNVLAPGVGVSLALLDFEDGRDLEVGLAACGTVLRDLLSVGYGRNLQAGRDDFYVGVNLVAVVGVTRLGTPRAR